MCVIVLVYAYYWYASAFGHCLNINAVYLNKFMSSSFIVIK